ncbi:MAG: prepilin-type N-terminal cleavage/methylation domain-containing protein [Deltaproteobacteria bacterium]|nr:prepilin-type N-terminal cleavage/methylation domain-containing protein [Candidatus Anaeroferrophillus wilburensis]MBN2889433.1 prepilin-type N-terminal cleavage/methylation domain-containing protein [Deltaproteobacteria bacterium]
MKKQQGGFTLIEMVIVIVLLGIVSLVIGQIINAAGRGYRTRGVMKSLQSGGRLAMMLLERELRHAVPNSVRISAGGEALEFGRTAYGGSYNAITGAVLHVDDDLSGRNFSGMWLVIYNTGTSDFYSGGSRFPIVTNTADRITCGGVISRSSPGQRYYVCDSAIKVSRNSDALLYYSGYEPGAGEDHGQFLCRQVAAIRFVLQPGTLAAEPAVAVTLSLAEKSLPLVLNHRIRLVNFP